MRLAYAQPAPPPVKLRPLLVPLCLLLLLGGLVAGGTYGWQLRREYLAKAAAEAALRERLAALEARLNANENELERLRSDPDYIERKIRNRLGWTRPNDVVLKFEP